MSQSKFNITRDDGISGAQVIAAVNAALQALASMNSGPSAPTPSFPYQLYPDANGMIQIRNSSNTAWLPFMSALGIYGVAGVATNTAYGVDTLKSVTNAYQCTAVGNNALKSNTGGTAGVGSNNTGVGYNALQALTTGYQNTAVGSSAGQNATTAYRNTSMGYCAGINITGNNNTAVGAWALGQAAATASSTTAIGMQAGAYATGSSSVTSLTSCIFIGQDSGPMNPTSSNEIVIGVGVKGAGNGTMTLGGPAQTKAILYGVLHKPWLDTAPASATATGTTGEIRVTTTHIYVCIATNTWVRAALATW